MKNNYNSKLVLFLSLIIMACSKPNETRLVQNIDAAWLFAKTESIFDGSKPTLTDSIWEAIDLPHDWAVADSVKKDNPSAESGGYFGGGIGWYRKHLFVPEEYKNKNLFITFDGVYMLYDVYVNGQKVGSQSNGYITSIFDITAYVKTGQNNLIALRVDNSVQPFDRWYTGCGIYRHVWLTATSKVYIPIWGTYITTPIVTTDSAIVNLNLKISNSFNSDTSAQVITNILSSNGKVVSTFQNNIHLKKASNDSINQYFVIKQPQIWDTENAYLYKAISTVLIGGTEVDKFETPFGIRNIAFSKDSGFILNNKKVLLKGVCLHHDLGGVGAAFFDKIMLRRLQLLKSMGCNAVRLSHYPYAPQVLDMCDSLGILVFNEAFDRWEARVDRNRSKAVSFKDSWRDDLGRFIERDRNHPSVIIWSVGNETYEQQSKNPHGIEIIKELVAFVHAKDPSRKVTSAMHPGFLKDPEQFEISNYNDVASYNYSTRMFAEWRKNDTSKIYLSSETKPYTDYGSLQLGEKPDFSGNSWFALSKADCGQFIWTGIDYFGESPGWPFRGFPWSPINTCGYKKGYAGFTQSIYSSEPMVQIAAFDKQLSDSLTHYQSWSKIWSGPPFVDHWSFPLKSGDSISVLTFTNCESVQLFLNDKLLGEKKRIDFPDQVIRWKVPYEKGTIKAIALNKGTVVSSHELKSAGMATRLKFSSPDNSISSNTKEIAIVDVSIIDSFGTICPNDTSKIDFTITGPGQILAVDNGNLSQHFSFSANSINANGGKCQVIVRSNGGKGIIVLIANAPNLNDAKFKIIAE